MLPGADGMRVADVDRPTFGDGAQYVRDEPVSCLVATADHIARSGRSDSHAMLLIIFRMEE